MKITKFILCLLFGLLFINAGLDKFLHYMPVPPLEPELQKVNEAFGTIQWLMPLVGAIELIGGILFIFPKTRAFGAIMLLPVMVGIMIHTSYWAPESLLIPTLVFLINLWILWDNKEKYRPIFCSNEKR
jgi:putative oxidoreductase